MFTSKKDLNVPHYFDAKRQRLLFVPLSYELELYF